MASTGLPQTAPPDPNLPCPPFFQIPGVNNLRDTALFVNGVTTSTSPSPSGLSPNKSHPPNTSNPPPKIRPGILFRSGNPTLLSRTGWSTLHKIGISTIFDLRSAPEIEKVDREAASTFNATTESPSDWRTVLEQSGLTRIWTPVFAATDYSPERLAERYMGYMSSGEEGFLRAYKDILTHAGPAYKTILTYLAQPNPGGALIHCTAGKDRTGLLIALILSYLGIGDEVIAEEYHATELGLASAREAHVKKLMKSGGFMKFIAGRVGGNEVDKSEMIKLISERGVHLGKEEDAGLDGIDGDLLEEGRRAAQRMVSARRETMIRTLEMVREMWGGAEGYFRSVVGVDDGVLEGLRENLVVEREGERL